MYLSFRIYYAFKTIGIKAYVLGGLYLAFLEMLKIKMFRYASGGPYLSFIKYKGNSLRFWWSVPLFPELWEITYVFGGFTLLLFILYILLFYELTITDKKKYVKKK